MNRKLSTQETQKPSTIRAGVWKWFLVNAGYLLALGLSMFLADGRLDWSLGWIYLALIVAGQTATTLLLLPTNPALLGERSWMQKGSKPWDTVIVSLGDAGWFMILILAGLDARFGWSPHLAAGLLVLGWVLMGLGYGVLLWAMASNRFFSSFVRIQTDRGHSVEIGGPYRYVRHPGYVGGLLLYTASPLALGSLWAFFPAALLFGLFIYRTVLEDRTLRIELTGYSDYANRVRYRLVPGVW